MRNRITFNVCKFKKITCNMHLIPDRYFRHIETLPLTKCWKKCWKCVKMLKNTCERVSFYYIQQCSKWHSSTIIFSSIIHFELNRWFLYNRKVDCKCVKYFYFKKEFINDMVIRWTFQFQNKPIRIFPSDFGRKL